MANIIAMFSRWAKSGLSTVLDGSSSSSSSMEPTRGDALDDFQRIMRMLPRIEAVLEDAEEREIQDRYVKLWLSELRHLAYDIDDVIDEYEYNVSTAQMEAKAVGESYHHGKCKRGDDERHDQDEQELSKIEELTVRSFSAVISYYGSGNLVSLKTLNIFECGESYFPKDEWIPCSLYTLHLNACQHLKFLPSYQNLSALRLLKIWRCKALTCLHGLEKMESLEKLEIIECPQFTQSPDHNLPSKLQLLIISNCPSLLCLPGLQQLFSLQDLKLYACPKLMLPPLEQLPFMLHVQLELFNCPKLIDWCQKYNLRYNNDESPNALFVRSSEQIKLWLEEVHTLFENICVLDYDGTILETEKWLAFRVLGFYICSSIHLRSIQLNENFTRIKQLRIWDCPNLEQLFGLYRVTTLQDVNICNCPRLRFLGNFPKSLQSLAIDRCNKLRSLDCKEINLSSLEIYSCSTLTIIRGLQNKVSLHFLTINNCPRLHVNDKLLPDTLNPNNVEISACPQLQAWCQNQDFAYI